MIGPPGAGKTMLAKRIPTILPPLSLREALETTKIHSVAGVLDNNTSLLTVRPYRSPHHTISEEVLSLRVYQTTTYRNNTTEDMLLYYKFQI